jgi:hypothetical protein
MSRAEEGRFSKNLGMTRRKGIGIKGGKCLSHHLSRTTSEKINKDNQPKMSLE